MAKPSRLKDLFRHDLAAQELSLLPTSYDVVGDILIFSDFPEELKSKERMIAKQILDSFRHIKVVCKKTGKFGGEFRTPKLRILGGRRSKETIHVENGIRVALHVEKVYFSARLGHERERINHLVQPGEKVLVMFSGCGVYPINLAKNSKASLIYGIEKNPVAHEYALENIRMNKIENVTLLKGDVRTQLPKLEISFDRMIMPLPKSAGTFLDVALPKLRKDGILHFYDFRDDTEFTQAETDLVTACKKLGRKCDILSTTKCGQFGPGKYRICIDAR